MTIADPAKRMKRYAAAANKGRITHAAELHGRVWVQPPYAFPTPFCRAVIEGYFGLELEAVAAMRGPEARASRMPWHERPAGARISEALFLLNVATATFIQQILIGVAYTCFVGKRLAFRNRKGVEVPGNRSEPVIFYLGDRIAEYKDIFAHLGQIVWSVT